MTQMQYMGLDQRTEVTMVKWDNLFIRKEDENYEFLVCSGGFVCYFHCLWQSLAIKVIRMWLQQPNDVTYYIWTIGDATIPEYCINVDVFDILEDT